MNLSPVLLSCFGAVHYLRTVVFPFFTAIADAVFHVSLRLFFVCFVLFTLSGANFFTDLYNRRMLFFTITPGTDSRL